MKLNQLTILQARDCLLKGEASALELVTACFKRIKDLNPQLNAFLTICEKEAIATAKKADRQISQAKNKKDLWAKKPLLGIPLALKDNFCTQGIRTTAASKVLVNYVPAYSATVVKRLQQAGAIIIGKTNLDAWAHGASGENSDFGPTKNPWDLERVPGGSSSGSAAAVAADLALAGTGTDTCGSLRFPASFTNTVALKPTYGRVSRYGIIAMASSTDSIGHLTKDVADAAYLLNVTAGQDKLDATTPNQPVPDYSADLGKKVKGLKIAQPKEYFTRGVDWQVTDSVKKALAVYQSLGAKIVPVSLPHTEYAISVYYIIQPAEVSSNLARFDGIRYGRDRSAFGDEAVRRIMLGTYTLSAGYYDAYYLKAMKVRTLIRQDFERVFKQVDLLLTPVSPFPPFKLGEKVADPLQMYLCDVFMAPVSLSGLPALALPAGFSDQKLPIGMQLIGPQFSEPLLFRAGNAYQQVTAWQQQKPLIK